MAPLVFSGNFWWLRIDYILINAINRVIMKRLIYQVSIGKPSKLYAHCIESVKNYCDRFGIEHIIQTTPILWIKPDPFTSNRSKEAVARTGCLPIFEKENAFNYLPYYDQVAIIDADVFIKPTCTDNIFDQLEPEYAFGGVVEREMPIYPEYQNKINNYTRMQYSTLKDVNWDWNPCANFMNMGVMVMNKSFFDYLDGDDALSFIRRPAFKKFVDGDGAWRWSTDQTLLNYWVKKRGVPTKNLDWTWNALYTAVKRERLDEANFIHFFLKDKLPDRGENVIKLMKDIDG